MRGALDKISNHFKAGSTGAVKRAEEIQANLSPNQPSFIKVMQKSNVSPPHYTCIPSKFCQQHLSRSDEMVVFEVESGKKYNVKLLGVNWAFSAGWRGFAIAEKLLENDVIVFHLVEPCKFKVYIVRARGFNTIDIPPAVIERDACATEKIVVKKRTRKACEKRPRLVPLNILGENFEATNSWMKSFDPENHHSSNVEDFRPSQSVSNLKDFKIIVDGATIELPQEVREDYFKLCHSRSSYLHGGFIKGINPGLAASIISGTVDISNAIKESKISTYHGDIVYWKKALDGFELFGMNVDFMQARLNRLSGLVIDLNRCKEVEIERARVEEKIGELKKAKRKLDIEIEGMKMVASEVEVMYEEEASAPW